MNSLFYYIKNSCRCLLLALVIGLLLSATVSAQTTAFTYQGRLSDAGNPASASYDMQFKLFDTVEVGTGTQQGATVTNPTVPMTNGIFTVSLDFGVEVFDGSARYLEICLRPAGSPDPYTVLAPRQPVTSTPYAIRSLSAVDASQLGGVAASEYVLTTDPRLTDERMPTAGSPNYVQNTETTQANANFNIGGNGVIGGDLTVLGTLNANFVGNFINNGTTPQPGANFNISGDGVAGGALAANLFNATTVYRIGGDVVLSLGTGVDNLFVGPFAGQANTSGSTNSFFGRSAGFNTTTGNANSFFGRSAGFNNTTGFDNSFFGVQAGRDSSTGSQNSFFGRAAGIGNSSGFDNSYFGAYTGQALSTGSANSFFGVSAGFNNTGSSNSFFGRSAGFQNTTGGDNSFFGVQAGRDNSTGERNSFFGRAAGIINSTGSQNSFFGYDAGLSNTIGGNNSFFGALAGVSSTGSGNAFFGSLAGNGSGSGSLNSFFGSFAGLDNRTGADNTAIGYRSGFGNLFNNTTTGSKNTFLGSNAGYLIGMGEGNVAIGFEAGTNLDKGANNTYVGREAGKRAFNSGNNLGNNNTFIGYNTNRDIGVNNSTAIGANAFVDTSNSIVLGTAAETVRIPGSLVVTGTVAKGGGSFKIDHPLDPANKTLSHSFVESPDMMNIYNGVVTLNRRGEAVITLPDYFEALNRDFRYQLTCIGGFAPVFIAEEIKSNRFKIAGGKASMKVSWQITGIRHDAYANAHRIPVEEEKAASERGAYLRPEAFKQSGSNLRSAVVKRKPGKRSLK